MRFPILLPALAAACGLFPHAAAQTVKVGVLGGVPVTSQTYNPEQSRPYVIGPSVEVQFFDDRFGVEFAALYRRLGTGYSFLGQLTPDPEGPRQSTSSRVRGNSWEFPLIGKYYFRGRNATFRPFLGTGYSLRNVWWTNSMSSVTVGQPETATTKDFHYRNGINVGATAVAGFDWKPRTGRFSFQPQFRYTYWGTPTYPHKRAQVDFMLGIRF